MMSGAISKNVIKTIVRGVANCEAISTIGLFHRNKETSQRKLHTVNQNALSLPEMSFHNMTEDFMDTFSYD